MNHAEDLIAKGLAALENGHTHLALGCFDTAAKIEKTPVVCSSLGYCLAAVRGDFDTAVDLCRNAKDAEPGNMVHYLNLGRVLLLAGRRSVAIDVFREGLRLGWDERIIKELEGLGTRRPPVLASLHRGHPLNKWLGLIRDRLGFS